MEIIKNTSYNNTTTYYDRDIDYIVLHYTAGTSSASGTAWNICNWFKRDNTNASADFCVDDEFIVQFNPEIKNCYTWAVGGNKYPTMSTPLGGTLYNKCNNWNSISIEMCSNKIDTSHLYETDTDWYFTDKTIDNAVSLVKYLMKEYNIPIERVITHHHVTGKRCPNPWCVNEFVLKGYYDFIEKVKYDKEKETRLTKCKVAINGKIAEYDTLNINGVNYIHARSFLEALGYTVGFNNVKKRVRVNKGLTLDIPTIIENNTAYIQLRDTINFLNKFDTFLYIQDKTIDYDPNTKVIVIS